MAQSAGAVEYTNCISAGMTILEFLRIPITPSLPPLPDPFWPGVVAHNRVQSMGQIELFDI